MPDLASPIDWVRGESRARWFAVYFVVLLLVLVAVASLLIVIESAIAPSELPPGSFLQFVSVAVYAPVVFSVTFVYNLLFPLPAARIGVSLPGLTVDYGLQKETFPWARVFVSGDRLFLVSKRLRVASAMRVTSAQLERIRRCIPTPR